MALRCPAVDTSQSISAGKKDIVDASPSLPSISNISYLDILSTKSPLNHLRHFNRKFNALNITYALVCSGNDDSLFTSLAVVTSKDIYTHGISVARKLLQPIHRYCCSISKVRMAANGIKIIKWRRSHVREDESVYYKQNNRSLLNQLGGHGISVDQSSKQLAYQRLSSGLAVLKSAYQRFNQWATRLPFLGLISGIGRYIRVFSKGCHDIRPTKRYILHRRRNNKQICRDGFGVYSVSGHICGLLRCSNYGLFGGMMQKRPYFCHRFLVVISMKHFLRKGCLKINYRAATAQNNTLSCNKESSSKCILVDSLPTNTVVSSQSLVPNTDRLCSSAPYFSEKHAITTEQSSVYGGRCEADTTEVCDNSLTRNTEYSETNDSVTIYSVLPTAHCENSQAIRNSVLCDLLAPVQTSHQAEERTVVTGSSQLPESSPASRQDTVMDILQSKLFNERPLGEVFQSDTISTNIMFLVHYLLQRPSSLLYETQKDSVSLEDAIKTFLKGLGGDEDLLNALSILAHSITEPSANALETLLTYTHDDSYIMNDLRSILIRLLAEQCWKDLLTSGYSLFYCNALRGIAPREMSDGRQEAEKDGWTPWFRYVEQGNQKAVQRLIEQCRRSHLSVFISAMEYGPWLPTATMMAVISRDTQLFDILSGAEIRMQDKCLGYTALMIAVLVGWDYAVEALAHSKIIECKSENGGGARPSVIVQHSETGIQDIMGKTALVCAVETNRTAYINMLISEAGLTDGVGTPAIAYAMDPAKLNIFKRLLPLEYNCKDAVGNSVLYYANTARIKLFSQLVLNTLNSQRTQD